MNWTKELPSKVGWYWTVWRFYEEHEILMVHVTDDGDGQLYVVRAGSSMDKEVGNAPVSWWMGPVEVPAPPKE